MATYSVTPTNGVSMALRYTAVAADDTADQITFDFNVDYPIAASIQVVNSTGDIHVALADAVITYPANGQVDIADGAATFAVTAGYDFYVVAQRSPTAA